MEYNVTAWETICAQLTIRAIVWNAGRVKPERLEKELKHSHVQILETDVSKGREEAAESAYEKIIQKLQELNIPKEQALLVTENDSLADYVYSMQHKRDDGNGEQEGTAEAVEDRGAMAVVYYEKEGSRRDVLSDMTVLGFEEIGIQFLDRVHKRANRLPWNILYTERTLVREITMSDLDELYEIYEEEGITDFTDPLFERKKEETYTRDYIRCMYYYYGYGMWIIRDRKSGRLIGRAGINHRDEGGQVLMEMGYIISTKYQNPGYAAEVCQAIIEYAGQELEIEQLHCFIHRMNQPSIHVAEKLGFVLQDSSYEQNGMLHFRLDLNIG